MSEHQTNRTLSVYLGLARQEDISPMVDESTAQSTDCIDPRLLTMSNDAGVQEGVDHASSSTDESVDAATLVDYPGTTSDYSAFAGSESHLLALAMPMASLDVHRTLQTNMVPTGVDLSTDGRIHLAGLHHDASSQDPMALLVAQNIIKPAPVLSHCRHVFYHPLSCPVVGCSFASTKSKPMRKDHLRQHIRKMHPQADATFLGSASR